MSPEVAFPMAFEVVRQEPKARTLHWLPLKHVVPNLDQLTEGHLRIVALRAAHAFGEFGVPE
jgi:hypothetical protein